MADKADQLLHIVRQTFTAEVRSDHPDLTLRQLGVLLVIYRTDVLQTVRGLASCLRISKPATSRALNRLEELELVQRTMDKLDRRSVLMFRTAAGTAMMDRLGAVMAEVEDK